MLNPMLNRTGRYATYRMKVACAAVALLFIGCATPGPDLARLADRAANTYGPQCQSMGPTNTQAWGVCIARAYDSAVAAYGGRCSDWQIKAPSYQDCVIDASVRAGPIPTSNAAGPFCIAMNVGGGVDTTNCR